MLVLSRIELYTVISTIYCISGQQGEAYQELESPNGVNSYKISADTSDCTLSSADTGEQVLVDVEDKTNKEITQHIKKILGKNE